MARWIDALLSYEFNVEHRPGRKHSNADAMSRKPCKQCGQVEKRPIIVWPVTTQMTDDSDKMKKEQSEDKDIAMVRTWIDKGERPS